MTGTAGSGIPRMYGHLASPPTAAGVASGYAEPVWYPRRTQPSAPLPLEAGALRHQTLLDHLQERGLVRSAADASSTMRRPWMWSCRTDVAILLVVFEIARVEAQLQRLRRGFGAT